MQETVSLGNRPIQPADKKHHQQQIHKLAQERRNNFPDQRQDRDDRLQSFRSVEAPRQQALDQGNLL